MGLKPAEGIQLYNKAGTGRSISAVRKFIIGAVAVSAIVTVEPVAQAKAETASDFLKSIEGQYSGRGKAKIIGDTIDTVACKIVSDFEAGKLAVSGDCASTKGKGKVNGGITANENKVAGTFVSPRPNLEITQSSGQFADGKMELFTSMVDHQKGGLIRVRQVISRTDDGIRADFFRYDNRSKSYKESGSIDLTKRVPK